MGRVGVRVALILTISSVFLCVNLQPAHAIITQAHCTNPTHPAGTGPNACSPNQPIIFKGDSPGPGSETFTIIQGSGCNPTAIIVYQTTIPIGPYTVTVELPSGQYSVFESPQTSPHPQCFNVDVLPEPIPEYPLGLPVLTTLTILAYGLVKRKTKALKSV